MTEREVRLVCGLVEKVVDKYKMSQFTRGQLSRELTATLTGVLTDEKSLLSEDDVSVGDKVTLIDTDIESNEKFIGKRAIVIDKYMLLRLVVEDEGASIVAKLHHVKKDEEE